MKYSLHPEAESDLREAAEYYRERAGPALSQSLLAEFERAVQLLMQRPLLGALWLYGKRRLNMRHFPYAIVYMIATEEIRVLAVAHHSRSPGYWRKRKSQPNP
ncbi:MAG: type II toxin-antitoxin system RelE/ParE family toxin [Candidatus Accumulibacter phosphatis]|jgi:plasmid stabilization system protein ParE|uniref:Type II toxin-antitoxin system RelE/ParE family toxin n=1 Tax=Candidatus Accumulibacter contiguus TaxID=2954381 RepID=A0ABX1TA03_9PROT|nr:type II toxin-antitoxin system RelE/ParE family toxin [Candidatus Accumulibacter contiguus]NMQ05908.1 type II toxin-antitoxin system RelE/ParE family toxin [Candidatus Accumulibacter contiguus]